MSLLSLIAWYRNKFYNTVWRLHELREAWGNLQFATHYNVSFAWTTYLCCNQHGAIIGWSLVLETASNATIKVLDLSKGLKMHIYWI